MTSTNTISTIEGVNPFDAQRGMSRKESENPPAMHPATLDEIQIRAYRVHCQHGGVSGGYTLEEWLEAEHQLNEESQPDQKKNEREPSKAKGLAMEYKVIRVKDSDTLQAKLNQEGNQGWRLVSVAMGPRGYLHAIMEKQASGS